MTRRPEPPGVILLHGRADQPTDAVYEYCENLVAALGEAGRKAEVTRLDWQTDGWHVGLRDLWRRAGGWRGDWVVVQYTALTWSRHAMPVLVPAIVALLRTRGARTAITFHDPVVYPGSRPTDLARRACQRAVMWSGGALAERAIMTVDLERPPTVRWKRRLRFVPVGSNVAPVARPARSAAPGPAVVLVFGVSPGPRGEEEVAAIGVVVAAAARRLPITLVAAGRGTEEAGPLLRALAGTGVEVVVEGLVGETALAGLLAAADAQLYVRQPASTRRTTYMAAIACGTPTVGWESSETRPPITEAGVRLVPEGDVDALAEALVEVLTRPDIHAALVERNRLAWDRHFSWDRIAGQMIVALEGSDGSR